MNQVNFSMHIDDIVDFSYTLDTYVIYPWVSDRDELIRPLRLGPGDDHVAIARIRQGDHERLDVQLVNPGPAQLVTEAKAALTRCLQLDYPYAALAELAREDRVLATALRHRGSGRGKLYPDLFEALCGIICARRTVFARIYTMMRNLAETFGTRVGDIAGRPDIYAFPKPDQIAVASDEALRGCGVGFRARGLASAAHYLADHRYTWHDWQHRHPSEVISELHAISGVGPYTANLAVNLSYGYGGAAHIDTYVTRIIGVCYLDDPAASPSAVAAYVHGRWGQLAEAVLDLLTTDTEVWAAELGIDIGVRSGARTT